MAGLAVKAFIGLGGNIGDPPAAMHSALAMIADDPKTRVSAVSSLYRTPPWGKTDQPDFFNAVAEVETALSARALLELCLSVETRLKRVRSERWGPRSIDLDILAFGSTEIDERGLQIPHPRMTERAFVLVPLAEIAPDLTIRGRSVTEWLKLLETSGIERLDDPRWRNQRSN